MNAGTGCVVAAVTMLVACATEPRPQGQMAVGVTHYDFAFDVETSVATVTITMTVHSAGNCLSLPLRTTSIDNVLIDDEQARVSVANGMLTACGPGWHANDAIALSGMLTIATDTWGDSQVGYSVTTDIEDNPFYYLVSWVGGCDRFSPCDATTNRFAHYRFTISHPTGFTALCPGVLTAHDTNTVCEFTMDGGPTYSTFGFAVSPSWQRIELGMWGTTKAVLYDMPSAGVVDALDQQAAAGFLSWMSERFGPYPYGDELRIAVGPTFWNGFEHPGNILLNDQLHRTESRYADPLTHVLLHEIAHQWAGDQTTLAAPQDFVWKEAMAEYLTFVYEEEVLEPGIAKSTAFAWKQFARFAEYYPVPAEPVPLLDYYGHVYGPGPMILFRQLEALFDREAVMAALTSLLGSPRAVSVAEVQHALEQTTGTDLSHYFASWVHGRGDPTWPRIAVSLSEPIPGTYHAELTTLHEPGPIGLAFAIHFVGPQNERHEVWVDLGVRGKPTTMIQVNPGFRVSDVIIDPHGHTLAFESSSSRDIVAGTHSHPWVSRDLRELSR